MRIQAVDASGDVAGEFPSIQAAGRAGYSVQRVHACLHGKAKSHRGLSWRRADGLHSLPQFVAARIIRTPGKWLTTGAAFDAFVESLPPDEREAVNRQDFGAALRSHFDSRTIGGIVSIDGVELRAA